MCACVCTYNTLQYTRNSDSKYTNTFASHCIPRNRETRRTRIRLIDERRGRTISQAECHRDDGKNLARNVWFVHPRARDCPVRVSLKVKYNVSWRPNDSKAGWRTAWRRPRGHSRAIHNLNSKRLVPHALFVDVASNEERVITRFATNARIPTCTAILTSADATRYRTRWRVKITTN